MQSFLISGGPIHTMVDGDSAGGDETGIVEAVLTRGDTILYAGSARQAGEIAQRWDFRKGHTRCFQLFSVETVASGKLLQQRP